MVGVEGIADWIGREVVDRDGEKVGKLADVYYDTTDHSPVFVAIKSGAFGRSISVAPLEGATLSRDFVRLDAAKELVKDAPQDASGGRLTGVDAVAVLRHFSLTPDPDLDGETRVCFQTAEAAEESERKRAEVAAEEARDASAGAASAATYDTAASGDEDADEDVTPVAGSGSIPPPAPRQTDRAPAPVAVPSAGSSELVAPEPGNDLPASAPYDDDDPLVRLAQLERRVAALEARL